MRPSSAWVQDTRFDLDNFSVDSSDICHKASEEDRGDVCESEVVTCHRRGVQFCESCIPELPLIFVVFTKKREEFILGPGDFKKMQFFSTSTY